LILLEISQILEEEINERGFDDVHVDTESLTKGFNITPIPESGPFQIGRSDITLYQERDWSPPELDMENIARWFPDKTLDIPLVEIEIEKNADLFLSPLSTDRDLFSPPDHVMGGVIHFGALGYERLQTQISSSQFVFAANEVDDILDSDFINYVMDHVDALRVQELYSEDELRDKLSEFKPDVFHFNEVLTAYQEDRTKILIILLSVFFEGYTEDILDKAVEGMRENENAGTFYSDWSFKKSLDACRYFGIVTENEYRIIDQIRDERNDYAHNPEKYHPDITSGVFESGTLNEAIELYEEIIGVKDSMLTDSS